MLCGYLPFEDPNTTQLYKKILKGDFELPEFLSDEAKDMLKRVLNTDPNTRYRIAQIRSHPWFNQVEPSAHDDGIMVGYKPIPVSPINPINRSIRLSPPIWRNTASSPNTQRNAWKRIDTTSKPQLTIYWSRNINEREGKTSSTQTAHCLCKQRSMRHSRKSPSEIASSLQV